VNRPKTVLARGVYRYPQELANSSVQLYHGRHIGRWSGATVTSESTPIYCTTPVHTGKDRDDKLGKLPPPRQKTHLYFNHSTR
jgi:hypothetical protein